MMSSNAISISDYSFTSSDSLVLDTNVWIYIYAPNMQNDWKTEAHSNAFSKIRSAQSEILIDVTILSEFSNCYARIEFEIFKSFTGHQNLDFKGFRKSQDYKRVAEAIADAIRRILNLSKLIGSGIEECDIEELLSDYQVKRLDFNDHVITEICKRNQCKLVTHDSDFANMEITLLTANKRLLSN